MPNLDVVIRDLLSGTEDHDSRCGCPECHVRDYVYDDYLDLMNEQHSRLYDEGVVGPGID